MRQASGLNVDTTLVAVVDTGTAWAQVDLGGVSGPGQQLTAPIACAAGCRLVGLRLDTVTPDAPYDARLTVTAMSTDRQSASELAPALHDPTGWVSPAELGDNPYYANRSLPEPGADGLHLQLTDPVGVKDAGALVLVNDRPTLVPAVLGTGAARTPLSGIPSAVAGIGLDGAVTALNPVATSAALPRVGASGVLVDLSVALASSDPAQRSGLVQEVWLSAGASGPTITRELAARGVTVTGTATAAGRERDLAGLAPARAVQLAASTSAAGFLLALLVGGAGLLGAGRNRLYELASLRVAGVRDRSLRRAVRAELLTLLTLAVVVGLAVGVGTARLTVRELPFYVDGGGPPLDTTPDPLVIGVIAGAAVLTVVLVAVVAAWALVRLAGPGRLRESIR